MAKKQKTLKDELATLQSIVDIQNTKGIQDLTVMMDEIILNSMDALANNYNSYSEVELRTLGATLRANLELRRVISNAKDNAEVLAEAIKRQDAEQQNP